MIRASVQHGYTLRAGLLRERWFYEAKKSQNKILRSFITALRILIQPATLQLHCVKARDVHAAMETLEGWKSTS
jgi:hypothetical protein